MRLHPGGDLTHIPGTSLENFPLMDMLEGAGETVVKHILNKSDFHLRSENNLCLL